MGEGRALGGEIRRDEVEHARGGPVEQRFDRVAMLGHGGSESREHRLAQRRDGLCRPPDVDQGIAQWGDPRVDIVIITSQRVDSGESIAPQLGVPGVAMAPRPEQPLLGRVAKLTRPPSERLEEQFLDGDPPPNPTAQIRD
jgi:hypothetical protein